MEEKTNNMEARTACCCGENCGCGGEGEKPQAVAGKYMIYKFVKSLFENDQEVHIGDFDRQSSSFQVRVDEIWKANYLNMIIGGMHTGWGENVFIYVAPSFTAEELPRAKPWETIFRGNANFDRAFSVAGDMGLKVDVVMFKPAIVQIPCDNAFNPDGIETYTFEQIAHNVFRDRAKQVVFTTSKAK